MTAESTPDLIGRGEQRAVLGDALSDAESAMPRVAVVEGEAGIGKTRLVSDFAATAPERGVIVLGGGCVDLGALLWRTFPGALPGSRVGPGRRSTAVRRMSNRQIRVAFFLSPKTVSVHVSHVLTKLGVAGRGEAAAVQPWPGCAGVARGRTPE